MAESIVFQNNNSLAIQWLRLCALFVGSEGSIPGWGINPTCCTGRVKGFSKKILKKYYNTII